MRRKITRPKVSATAIAINVSSSQSRPPKRRQTRARKSKAKKIIKISGLDLLHNETLLSTSVEGEFVNFISCKLRWKYFF